MGGDGKSILSRGEICSNLYELPRADKLVSEVYHWLLQLFAFISSVGGFDRCISNLNALSAANHSKYASLWADKNGFALTVKSLYAFPCHHH